MPQYNKVAVAHETFYKYSNEKSKTEEKLVGKDREMLLKMSGRYLLVSFFSFFVCLISLDWYSGKCLQNYGLIRRKNNKFFLQ